MLVQCPRCKIKYKVADEVVKDSSPAFHCSRCEHTFDLETFETTQPAVADALIKEPAAETVAAVQDAPKSHLEFAFPSHTESERWPPRPELSGIEIKKADDKDKEPLKQRDEAWTITPELGQTEMPFTIARDSQSQAPILPSLAESSAVQFQLPAAPPAKEDEFFDNVLSIEPYRDQQVSIVPYLALFGILVILFSFAAAYYQAHPVASEGIVGQIPLVGPSVLKNNHLKNGVLLKSLQGSYQAVQGNREVFVVSGTAINQNPVVIRRVRLAGQIFSDEGKEVEQQAMWLGNALSAKIVRGMTVQDIADLQKLEPLRSFEIPPGDNVPFTLVFLKPNKVAKDFSCEVTAAEGDA